MTGNDSEKSGEELLQSQSANQLVKGVEEIVRSENLVDASDLFKTPVVRVGEETVGSQSQLFLEGDASKQSENQLKKGPDLPVPKSYAKAVGVSPNLSKFDIDVSVIDGQSIVEVPAAVLEDSTPLWEDFLIGRFPDTAPHVAKIHVIVNKIWNLGDMSIRIDVFEVDASTVKFRIRNAAARLHVLRRSMWNICNLPMVVSKWTPIVEDAQPAIKSMPMWVVIKNVPHSMFSWKELSFLASPVGEPKRLHQETELVTNFDEAKIFVEVDLSKELPETYYFGINGDKVCVQYEYPWLPQRCGECCKWGHSEDFCLVKVRNEINFPKIVSLGESTLVGGVRAVSPASVSVTTTELVKKTELVPNTELVTNTELVASLGENVIGQVKLVVTDGHPSITADNNLVEEGEIPTSPVGIAEPVTEGDWLVVRHSGGRPSTKNSASPLVHGHVQIASPSRYAVLLNSEVEAVNEICNSDPGVSKESGGNITEISQKNTGQDGTVMRPNLPRNSKSSHRYLSGSTQSAKDQVPSKFSKKKTQKKN